jgi:hypothetical protein
MVTPDSLDIRWLVIVLVALAGGLVVLLAERPPAWAAVAAIGLALLGLLGWGSFGSLASIGHHPFAVGCAIVLYLAVGTLWSLGRWWLFVTARRSQLTEVLLDWLQANGRLDCTSIPEDLVVAWRDHLRATGISDLAAPPAFADHRRRIVVWLLAWPVSVIWTVVHELLVDSVRWLLLRLRRAYIGIAAWVYRDVPRWLAPDPPPTAPGPARPALSIGFTRPLGRPSLGTTHVAPPGRGPTPM